MLVSNTVWFLYLSLALGMFFRTATFSSLLIRLSTKDPHSTLNIGLNWEAYYKVALTQGIVLNRVSNFWSGW